MTTLFVPSLLVILFCQQSYGRQSSESSEELVCDTGFFRDFDQCRECTSCGPNFYLKKECGEALDAECDWCLSKTPALNEHFYKQCSDYRRLYQRLNQDLSFELHNQLHRSFRHSLGVNWGLASLVIACGLVIVLTLNKCWKRQTLRVVTLTPPELTKEDKQNIVFAAEHLRNKRGGKYQRLDYV